MVSKAYWVVQKQGSRVRIGVWYVYKVICTIMSMLHYVIQEKIWVILVLKNVRHDDYVKFPVPKLL